MLKRFLSIAVVVCLAFGLGYSATLTVTVQDESGNGVASAQVVINKESGIHDPNNTSVTTTNGSGQAAVTLDDNTHYGFNAGAQGKMPSWYEHVYTDSDKSMILTVFDAPANTADLTVTVTHGDTTSDSVIIFANIRNRQTGEHVSFGVGSDADKDGSEVVSVYAIPINDTQKYDIDVFCPTTDKGRSVAMLIDQSTATAVDLTAEFAYVPTNQNNSGEVLGDIVFEGRVENSSNTAVSDVDVSLHGNSLNLVARTDANGYFAFYENSEGDLFSAGNYTLDFMKNGYKGQFVEWSYTIGASSQQVVELQTATGKIKGIVKIDGVPVPGAWVNVWPDWDRGDHESVNEYERPGMGHGNKKTEAGAFTMTGIASGRYNLQVWTEFNNQPGDFNDGADGTRGTSGTWGDDLIVQVDEAAGGDNGVYATILNAVDDSVASSTVYADADSDGVKEIIVSMTSGNTGANTITGTITFIENPAPDPIANVIIIAREDYSSEGTQPKAGFTVLSAANALSTSGVYSYTISNLPDGTYRVQVIAPNFGMKFDEGRRDNESIELSATGTTSKTVDLKMAPAGIIEGSLVKPDGTIFRRIDGSDWMGAGVNADSWSLGCWGHGEVGDNGLFKIEGLLPGEYTLRVHGWGNNYPYATARKLNVIVEANQSTNVTIPLKEGVPIYPVLSEALPADVLLLLEQGNTGPGAHMRLVYTPADVTISLKNFDEYFGDHEGAPSIHFWGGDFEIARLEPGMYNFYINLGVEQQETSHYFRTIIGRAKNIEVAKNKQVDAYTTRWNDAMLVENVPITMSIGEKALSGTYSGVNTIREADQKVIEKNHEKFMEYVPKVILSSKDNEFLGWGWCVPNPENMRNIDKSPNLKAAEENKDGPGPGFEELVFGIHYLVEQEGAKAVVKTPNYPPNFKRVNIPGTWSIDMDLDVGAGASVTGYVRTGETAVAGAVIEIKGRLLKRSIIAESDGSYLIPGLAPGVYRLQVKADGYALDAEKITIYGRTDKILNFNLTACAGSISGTVYARKIPYPLTSAGDKIVAWDDTANGLDPAKEIALYEVITESDGMYTIKPVIEGHTYKVAIVVPGKAVQIYSPSPAVPTVAGSAVTGIDFTYKQKELELGIIAYPHSDGASVAIEGESPAELTDISAAYNEGNKYNAATAVAISESEVESIGDNRWMFTLPNKIKYYNVRFTLSNGVQSHEIDFAYDPYRLAAKEEDVDDDAVANGEFMLDPKNGDPSGIYFSAGCITLDAGSIPQCTMEKEDNELSVEAGYYEESTLVAGDIYHVDLTMNGSQQNNEKTMTLTIGFDSTAIPEDKIDELAIVQWNATTQTWDPIDSPVMVDAMSNTCSVEVNSIAGAAASSSASRRVAKAQFNGKEYVIDRNAQATADQSGIFMAILSGRGQSYSGTELLIFNVPNPFNLQAKTVTLSKGVGTTQMTTTGTVLRLAVPASLGADIDARFRIYNIAGELVREIKAKDEVTGGVDGGYYYYIEWDGENKDGAQCASGVYFCYCEIGDETKVIKMAIIK